MLTEVQVAMYKGFVYSDKALKPLAARSHGLPACLNLTTFPRPTRFLSVGSQFRRSAALFHHEGHCDRLARCISGRSTQGQDVPLVSGRDLFGVWALLLKYRILGFFWELVRQSAPRLGHNLLGVWALL